MCVCVVCVCVMQRAKGQWWRGGSIPADRARGESQMWADNSLSTYTFQLIIQHVLFTIHYQCMIYLATAWLFSLIDPNREVMSWLRSPETLYLPHSHSWFFITQDEFSVFSQSEAFLMLFCLFSSFFWAWCASNWKCSHFYFPKAKTSLCHSHSFLVESDKNRRLPFFR